MRRTLLLPMLLAACGGGTPLVEAGGFHLAVQADSAWRDLDARYDVAPDGSITGHGWTDAYACVDRLDSKQLEVLTDNVNAAELLVRADSPDCGADTTWQFQLEGTDGAAAGWHNEFQFADCDPAAGTTDVSLLLKLLSQRLDAARDAGRCTACPVELSATGCYGDDFGLVTFCQGQTRELCNEAAAGAVVACDGDPSLECDPLQGWVPATTWSIAAATLYRWNGTAELDLTIDVHNLGAALAVDRLLDYLQAYDAGGQTTAGPTSAPEVDVAADTTASVDVKLAIAPTTVLAQLSLRERPWALAPLAPTVPVTTVDGPPP